MNDAKHTLSAAKHVLESPNYAIEVANLMAENRGLRDINKDLLEACKAAFQHIETWEQANAKNGMLLGYLQRILAKAEGRGQ